MGPLLCSLRDQKYAFMLYISVGHSYHDDVYGFASTWFQGTFLPSLRRQSHGAVEVWMRQSGLSQSVTASTWIVAWVFHQSVTWARHVSSFIHNWLIPITCVKVRVHHQRCRARLNSWYICIYCTPVCAHENEAMHVMGSVSFNLNCKMRICISQQRYSTDIVHFRLAHLP
jgi:hypothetical protein